MKKTIRIRPAEESDIDTILHFIRELAIYEKLEHEVVADARLLRKYLFGKKPAAEVIFLLENDVKAGFALYFTSYSTFLGRPGIYLEDLFVLPKFRGQGYGKGLLAWLATEVVKRDFGRLEWSVLNWNTPAVELYKSLGSAPMDGWTVHRLTGQSLQDLAKLKMF